MAFHSKIVKTSDDRAHKSLSVTVTTYIGGKLFLSESMARGLVCLAEQPSPGSIPVPIGSVNIAVYTAQSLHSRFLTIFENARMELTLTAFGLEVADALRNSGKLNTGGAA